MRRRSTRPASPREAECSSASSRRSRGGTKQQSDKLLGQGSIFDLGEPSGRRRAAPPSDDPASGEFEKNDLLRLEKETLGLYVSDHPLTPIRDQLRRKTDCAINEIERRRDGEIVLVGGIVSSLKQMTTKKGDPMVFAGLEDVTGSCEVVAFNSVVRSRRATCSCRTAC